jgi:hypothetical protein
MPYQKTIDSANPLGLVLLVDQSSSMLDLWGVGDGSESKAQAVALTVDTVFSNLVEDAGKSGTIKDYYYVAVIGYGNGVGPILKGPLAGQDIVTIGEIAANAAIQEVVQSVTYENGETGEERVSRQVWLDPVGENGTPMRRAFEYAEPLVERLAAEFPKSHPPIVINITDGEPTDGSPEKAAEQIRNIATEDGTALVFNAHISSVNADPIELPDRDSGLPDKYARMLFGISSVLPGKIQAEARAQGYRVSELSRGFIFNAGPETLTRFLDTGTKVR